MEKTETKKITALKLIMLILIFALLQKIDLSFSILTILISSVIQYKYRSRYVGILLCLVIGYTGWQILYDVWGNLFEMGLLQRYQWTILQRLGLLFYVLSFSLLQKKFTTADKIAWFGDLSKSFNMPLFFKGTKKEKVKNFLIIYLFINNCHQLFLF